MFWKTSPGRRPTMWSDRATNSAQLVDVGVRVEDRGGHAGGAGGVVHAHHFVSGDGEQAEGVAVAQVLLLGEGEAAEVVERPNRLRA